MKFENMQFEQANIETGENEIKSERFAYTANAYRTYETATGSNLNDDINKILNDSADLQGLQNADTEEVLQSVADIQELVQTLKKVLAALWFKWTPEEHAQDANTYEEAMNSEWLDDLATLDKLPNIIQLVLFRDTTKYRNQTK